MTPQQLADEWRYYVHHFRNHRDNCTDTPHGQKLRAVYQRAFESAVAEWWDANEQARATLEEA